jgi:hypothetical protein
MANSTLWSAVSATFPVPAIAVTDVGEADSSLRTTPPPYDLCSAPSDHPDYAPAIYSCRAFLKATVRYHDAVSGGKTFNRLICYPSGATLGDACTAFAACAKHHARKDTLMGEMPVMGVVRALEHN